MRSPPTRSSTSSRTPFSACGSVSSLCIRTDSSLEKGIAIYSSENRVLDSTPLSVEGVCQSRIGLIGNPSDGYFGQTISITLDNFATKVVLLKSDRLTIVPHPVYPAVFRR